MLPQPPTRARRILVSYSPRNLRVAKLLNMMESIILTPSLADGEWDLVAEFPATGTAATSGTLNQSSNSTLRPGQDDSDVDSEEDYAAQMRGDKPPKPKQGGYDSRIEQILYENPQLPVLITDAGKSSESGGKYIVYTIRTGV